MPEPVVVSFEKEKETKNTTRFAAVKDGSPPAVTTLYVQGWALPEGTTRCKATLEFE